jgi:hypothetical protein
MLSVHTSLATAVVVYILREKSMSEASSNFGAPGIAERLSVLRTPQPGTPPLKTNTPKRMRLEVLIGVVVVLAGITMALFLSGGGSSSPAIGGEPATSSPQIDAQDSRLMAGEAFIAIAVDPGNFPPSLMVGDTVRVVVTPSNDGNGSVRSLKELTVVQSVTPPADMGTQFVVTVRAPESLATAVAASGAIHLSIVKGDS